MINQVITLCTIYTFEKGIAKIIPLRKVLLVSSLASDCFSVSFCF